MFRTILFFIVFWITVIVSSPLAFMLWIIEMLGFHSIRGVTGNLVQGWSKFMLWIMGVRVIILGKEQLPIVDTVCVLSNHQGDVDILVILAYMPWRIGFITKSQAAWIPFLNIWITAIGGIYINRRKTSQAHKAIERGIHRIRSGSAMAVFPEGTRSRCASMGEFRNGSFKLATKSGAVIVPLTLNGTYKVWEEKKKITPAVVTLTIGEFIPTSGLTLEERKKLPAIVRRRIEEGLSNTPENVLTAKAV